MRATGQDALYMIGTRTTYAATTFVAGLFRSIPTPKPLRYREEWLTALAEKLEPEFAAASAPLGAHGAYKIGVGEAHRRRAKKILAIGLCYQSFRSEARKVREITICLSLDDEVQVAATLAHELAHAALPDEVGHKHAFAVLVKRLRLAGKPTCTYAGDAFREWVAPILDELGPYPHTRINKLGSAQTTRMVKMSCAACGYIARTTRKNLDTHGAVFCPCNRQRMAVAV